MTTSKKKGNNFYEVKKLIRDSGKQPLFHATGVLSVLACILKKTVKGTRHALPLNVFLGRYDRLP